MTREREEKSKKHQSEARRKALISEYIFDLSSLVPTSFCKTQNQVDILQGTLSFLKQSRVDTKMKDQELILLKDELRSLRSRVQALESECNSLKDQISRNLNPPVTEEAGRVLNPQLRIITASSGLPIPTIPISQCRNLKRKNAEADPETRDLSQNDDQEDDQAQSKSQEASSSKIVISPKHVVSETLVIPKDRNISAPIIAIPETLGVTIPPSGGVVNNYMIFVSGQSQRKRKSENRRAVPCPIAPKSSNHLQNRIEEESIQNTTTKCSQQPSRTESPPAQENPVSQSNCNSDKTELKRQADDSAKESETHSEPTSSIIPSGVNNLITIAEQEISNETPVSLAETVAFPTERASKSVTENPDVSHLMTVENTTKTLGTTQLSPRTAGESTPKPHVRIDEIVNFPSDKPGGSPVIDQIVEKNSSQNKKSSTTTSLAVSNLVDEETAADGTKQIKPKNSVFSSELNKTEAFALGPSEKSSPSKGMKETTHSSKSKSSKQAKRYSTSNWCVDLNASFMETSPLKAPCGKDAGSYADYSNPQALYHDLMPYKHGTGSASHLQSKQTDPFWGAKRSGSSKNADRRPSNIFSVDFLRTDALPSVASVISKTRSTETNAGQPVTASSAIQKLSHFANSRPKSPVPIINTQHKPRISRSTSGRHKASSNDSRVIEKASKASKKATPTKSSRGSSYATGSSSSYPSSNFDSRSHMRYAAGPVGYGPLVPTEDQSQEVNLSNSIFDINSFNDPQSYQDTQGYLFDQGNSGSKSQQWDSTGMPNQAAGNPGTFWHHSYGFINAGAAATEPTYLYPTFETGWSQGTEKTSSGFSFQLSNPSESQTSQSPQKQHGQSGINQYPGSFHIANMLPEVGARSSRSSRQVDGGDGLSKRHKTSSSTERPQADAASRSAESYSELPPTYESSRSMRSSYSTQQPGSSYYSAGQFVAPPPYNFLAGAETITDSDSCQHMPRTSNEAAAKTFMPNFSLRQ